MREQRQISSAVFVPQSEHAIKGDFGFSGKENKRPSWMTFEMFLEVGRTSEIVICTVR